MEQRQFHAFVGSETGLLKGVDLNKKTWCNINTIEQATRELEIKCMCWAQEERQALIALKNQTVCVFDTEEAEVKENHDFSNNKADIIIGMAKFNTNIVTCTKTGILRLWEKNEAKTEIQVGSDIETMKQNINIPHLLATGGCENDLKIYDINKLTEPIFKAKNVRNDWLNLRVPVHVTNLEFIPDSQKIITSTNHHQVRVYDPSSTMRRPVLDMTWGEYPIRALSLRNNNYQVMVGNTHGDMALLDIRKKGHEVMKFKGFAGAIRDIVCHKSLDIAVACGLDRFFRIYDINSKKMTEKFYMKSRLNCILLSSKDIHDKCETEKDSIMDNEVQSEGEEDIWDSIPEVKTKSETAVQIKRKHLTEETDLDSNKNSSVDLKPSSTKKRKIPKKKNKQK